MRASAVPLLAAFAIGASAHATWQELWIGNVDAGSSCVRLPQNNNPVTMVTSNDIACNANARSSSGICPIIAGSEVTVEMHQQPNDRSCSNEAIGGAHYGPVSIYMAKVDNAATAVGSSANWFKIHHAGLVSTNPDYFANQVLNDNCGHWTFKIPADIAPGDYLLRAETIALHVAGQTNGAQFYMSCYQVRVTSNGNARPPTVKLPGAYSPNDPGILVNIHQDLNSYVVPGPSPYGYQVPPAAQTPWPRTATWNTANQPATVPTVVPSISGAPPPVDPTSTNGGTTTTGAGPTPTTPTTTTAPQPTQTKYGQCGGNGWTGPTQCEPGSTCNAVSAPWYYQCQ